MCISSSSGANGFVTSLNSTRFFLLQILAQNCLLMTGLLVYPHWYCNSRRIHIHLEEEFLEANSLVNKGLCETYHNFRSRMTEIF